MQYNYIFVFFFHRLKYRKSMGKLPSDRSEWNKVVYVTSDLAKGYFNKFARDNFNEHIPISRDRLWMAYLRFYMPKTSCFRQPFSNIITKFIQHGLVRKWMMDYTTSSVKVNERGQSILKLEHIQGLFHICFGLYAMAFVVFLLEIFSAYFKSLQMHRMNQNKRDFSRPLQ